MWYFAWVLGLGFAVLLAVVSAVWVEFEDSRQKAFYGKDGDNNSSKKSSKGDDESLP